MHARRCSGQLYNALEVPPNASEADIRKAYHRKAMIYHPDKAGDAFRVQFQEIQEADEILRDPQRRRMYDIFGRAGMRAIEGGIGAEYADLLVSNLHRIRWIFLILAYFFLMCFAELVILIRQVDGEAGYNWFVVFIPIWIMDLILGGGALYFLFIMLRHPSKIPLYFVMFGNMASFACGTVFVALALNGTVTWHVAFIPLLSLTGLYFYSELRQAGLGTYRETLRQAGDPEAETVTCGSEGYMAYVVTIVWRVTCICAFSILLWMRVTQAATFSYYVVFLPIFLWMWLPLIWRLYVICFTSRIVKHISDKAIMSFMLIFSYLNSFLTIGLLAVKCHQAEVGAEQLSLVYVLIPPMVVTVLLSMAFCAIALVLPADMMQLGAADTYNSTLATASASEPLMQAQRANATANQFTYAHQAAERGDISGATKAATDGVKMAYGATS